MQMVCPFGSMDVISAFNDNLAIKHESYIVVGAKGKVKKLQEQSIPTTNVTELTDISPKSLNYYLTIHY